MEICCVFCFRQANLSQLFWETFSLVINLMITYIDTFPIINLQICFLIGMLQTSPRPDTLNQPNIQTPLLKIQGEFVLINGKEIPYEKQMIRNNSFYITDLGLDLPLQEEIKHFDQKYFTYHLNKQIIKELELHHPAIGLKILQAMPNLSQKHYAAIFWRLSLAKIKKIVMDDCFYMHIISKIVSFMSPQQNYQYGIDRLIEQSVVCNLDAPYKRLLYILDEVHCSQALRQVFYIISYEIVLQIITNAKFQSMLSQGLQSSMQSSESNQTGMKINVSFLRNTLKVVQSIVSLTKMPNELIQLHHITNQRALMKTLLNSKFIHIFTVNFQHLFNFDRHNLTKLLSIIAAEQQSQLWGQVIAKKYQQQKKKVQLRSSSCDKKSTENRQSASQTPSQEQQIQTVIYYESVTNQRVFFLLITNNFYEKLQPDWELTELILQCIIKNNVVQAKFMLFKLFSQISSHIMTASVIQLVIKLVKKLCSTPQFDRNQLKTFLIQFTNNLDAGIMQEYRNFQANQKSNLSSIYKCEQKENLFLQGAFLNYYSILMELKLFKLVSELQVSKSLSQLMRMTKNKKGVVEGKRRAFMNRKQIYLVDVQLKLKFKNNQNKELAQKNNDKLNGKNSVEDFIRFLRSLE